jgi:hypothetical protein
MSDTATHLVQEMPPRRCDRDAAMPTLEQHDAEMLLQLFDTQLADAERQMP